MIKLHQVESALLTTEICSGYDLRMISGGRCGPNDGGERFGANRVDPE